jgi:hypothetical protein
MSKFRQFLNVRQCSWLPVLPRQGDDSFLGRFGRLTDSLHTIAVRWAPLPSLLAGLSRARSLSSAGGRGSHLGWSSGNRLVQA